MTCFVKGKGQVRLGYVPIVDGKPGTYAYKTNYDTTYDDEWTELTYEFTLKSETVVNLVLMNPKGSSHAEATNKLVDDFTLTTADGGSTVEPTPDPTPSDNIFNETFLSSQGDFTIDNKVLPDGTTYVWSYAESYGMKASAYVNGKNNAAESWLISPVIDLSYAKEATLNYEQAANYFNNGDNFANACSVKVKEEGGEWKDLAVASEIAGNSWTFVPATAELSGYAGKKIQIAFAYTSSSDIAGIWEVKNLVVKGDVTTGINAATVENGKAQAIYSLDGRKMTKLVKGINIVNGKKIYVK